METQQKTGRVWQNTLKPWYALQWKCAITYLPLGSSCVAWFAMQILEMKSGRTPFLVPLAFLYVRWQSASLVHPVCYFWSFFNNLLSGFLLICSEAAPVLPFRCVQGFQWHSLFPGQYWNFQKRTYCGLEGNDSANMQQPWEALDSLNTKHFLPCDQSLVVC